MPNLDGTGPQGLGPLTGKKTGRCVAKGTADQPRVHFTPGERGDMMLHGVGRSGRPYGGGQGRCFGGSHGMSRGRRFGR